MALASGHILQRLCLHKTPVTWVLAAAGPLGPFCVSADAAGSIVMWLVVSRMGNSTGGGQERVRGSGGCGAAVNGREGGLGKAGMLSAPAALSRGHESESHAQAGGDCWLEKAGDILVEGLRSVSLVHSTRQQERALSRVACYLLVAHGSGFAVVNLGPARDIAFQTGCVAGAAAGAVQVHGEGGALEVLYRFEGLYREVCSGAAAFDLPQSHSTPGGPGCRLVAERCGVGVVTCGADSSQGSVVVRVWSLLLPCRRALGSEGLLRGVGQTHRADHDGTGRVHVPTGVLRLVHTLASNLCHGSGEPMSSGNSDDEAVPDSEDDEARGVCGPTKAPPLNLSLRQDAKAASMTPCMYQLGVCARSVLLVGQGTVEWWDVATACQHESFSYGSFPLDSTSSTLHQEGAHDASQQEDADERDGDDDEDVSAESDGGYPVSVLISPCVRSDERDGTGRDEVGATCEHLYLGTPAGAVECADLAT